MSPMLHRTSKDETTLLEYSGHTNSNKSTILELETWKHGPLRCVETTRTLLYTTDGTVAGIFGMTRELSVVERDEFLRQLGSQQRLSPNDAATSLDPNDDDAGLWWQE